MEDVVNSLKDALKIVENFENEWENKLEQSLREFDELFSNRNSTISDNESMKRKHTKKTKRLETIDDIGELSRSSNESHQTQTFNGTVENCCESISENSLQQRRPTRAAKLKVLENLKEKPLNSKLRRPSNINNQCRVAIKNEKFSEIHENSQLRHLRSQRHNSEEIKNVEEAELKENDAKRKSDESEDKNNRKKIDNSLEIVQNDNASVISILSDDDIEKMPPPSFVPSKKKNNRKNKKSKDHENSTNRIEIKIEKQSLDNTNASGSVTKSQDAVVRLEKLKIEKLSTESIKSLPEKGKKGNKKVLSHKPIKEEIVKENDVGVVAGADVEKDNGGENKENSSQNNEKNLIEPRITRHSSRNNTKTKERSNDSVYEDAVTDQESNEMNKVGKKDKKNSDEGNKGKVRMEKSAVVRVEKIKMSALGSVTPTVFDSNRTNSNSMEKPTDATFVSAMSSVKTPGDLSLSSKLDATFVAAAATNTDNVAGDTFVVDKINDEEEVNPKNIKNNIQVSSIKPINTKFCDTTFDVIETAAVNLEQNGISEKSKNKNDKKNIVNEDKENTLITEDESEEEEKNIPPPKVLQGKKLRSKIELFSPFVQSPVKKKVEAFEKRAIIAAAAVAISPIPQRQTRTKSKLKQQQQLEEQQQENIKTKETDVVEVNQKTTTPQFPSRLARIFTPQPKTTTTPTLTNPIKKVQPSSTSKLQGLQKTISLTSLASSKSSSLSQENCAQLLLQQHKSKLNHFTEEKKKIREMKTQMVLKTKEAKDKERQDRLKKQLEEKEEKARKIEADRRKQLEELQKNTKISEEIQRKLEKMNIEKTGAIPKDKIALDKIQKTKEVMKLKYQQNQVAYKQQQEEQYQRFMESQKKYTQLQKQHDTAENLRYNFDMLNSDDSTDDEEKVNHKKPQPPTWSKSSVRKFYIERQTYMPTKIIDSFFSVQPETPDLREIFPDIDPKNLKRNSSIVWKTPPRYSELPKY